MELLLTLWGTKSPAGGAGAPAVFFPTTISPHSVAAEHMCGTEYSFG